jgi:FtsZ-binding cell division protein ZapB
MSDELQTEIDRLKSENANLTKNVSTLTKERDGLLSDRDDLKVSLKEANAEARDRRHALKAVEEERDSFAVMMQELEADRDGLKAKIEAEPNEHLAKINELTGTLRGMKHERAFEKIAKGLKVTDPGRLADLISLARYAPEADDPDEEKITTTFAEALKGRSWLVDPEPAVAPPAAPHATNGTPKSAEAAKPNPPAPGSDRGMSVESEAPTGKARKDGKPVGAI